MINIKPLVNAGCSGDVIVYLHDMVAQINQHAGYEIVWLSHEVIDGEPNHLLFVVPQESQANPDDV